LLVEQKAGRKGGGGGGGALCARACNSIHLEQPLPPHQKAHQGRQPLSPHQHPRLRLCARLQGLLRCVLNCLQFHGEHLSRGWAPLLRLLEAIPAWQEPATISLAFQSVELICG